MTPAPDSTLADPQQVIADLRRANDELRRTLDERTHERDEALQERDERTRERDDALHERDDALQRERATAEVLQVINSSPGDLAPVFEAMLEKALKLCDAAFGILFLHDAAAFRAVAMRGVPPIAVDFLRAPIRVLSGGAFAPLLRGEAFVQIADITDDEVYRSGNRARRMLADEAGARTALWVALHRENTLLGTFVLYRQEVRTFTEKQIALLQNFATQAVIAMENARLITETREALEQQTATAGVLGVINSSPGDLAPVFDAMLEKALRLCSAEFGGMQTFDGEMITTVATRGIPADLLHLYREPRVPNPAGAFSKFLRGEELLHITDITAPGEALSSLPNYKALAKTGAARTALELALRKEGVLVGSMWFYRKEIQPFTDKQIALLQNFAAQAVIAMENARLITETREAVRHQRL